MVQYYDINQEIVWKEGNVSLTMNIPVKKNLMQVNLGGMYFDRRYGKEVTNIR